MSYVPISVMLVTTVTLPLSTSPVPTTVLSTITSTGPLGTFAPVVLSVTLATTVTLPAVLLTTPAAVVLSRGTTLIGTTLLVSL